MRAKAVVAAATLLTLAACASQQAGPRQFSDITVETDLAAIQSREAVSYWQTLSADLETALAAELAGNIGPGGNALVVDVDELSLQETFALGTTLEDVRLSGQATVLTPGDGRPDESYTVTATATEVIDFLPEGTDVTTISPTSREYYGAVVRAFARGTADALRAG